MLNSHGLMCQYTRQDAIDDGVLIDVSAMAREAGFKFHTVVTATVWHRIVQVPNHPAAAGQSEKGRLWDVLWMSLLSARLPGHQDCDRIRFRVLATREDGELVTHEPILHIGPGDQGQPVLIIMFPEDE